MEGLTAYVLSKKYIEKSLLGGGAIVGKNVKVSSIVEVGGDNVVTFSYTLDDGTTQTSTMTIKNGDSAYDIALKNGFIGTEAEWLESLKMDVTELETVIQQEVADQIGTTVEDSVTEQIDNNTATTDDIDALWT